MVHHPARDHAGRVPGNRLPLAQRRLVPVPASRREPHVPLPLVGAAQATQAHGPQADQRTSGCGVGSKRFLVARARPRCNVSACA